MPAAKLTFTPLYSQIKTSILNRIADGEWGPGSFLPSEIALAREYGVSQGTLRKALNELTLEKRLVRFQGKGTAVAVLDADSSLFPFFMLCDREGSRVYPLSQTDGIQQEACTAEEAEELQMAQGSKVIRIHRMRVLDDHPVINEYIILPAERFPDFSLDLEKLPNTLYEFYYQRFGIMVISAREELSAVLPTAADQRYLRCTAGKPLLEVRRKAFDIEGNIVELRRSRIDTECHHYRIELH